MAPTDSQDLPPELRLIHRHTYVMARYLCCWLPLWSQVCLQGHPTPRLQEVKNALEADIEEFTMYVCISHLTLYIEILINCCQKLKDGRMATHVRSFMFMMILFKLLTAIYTTVNTCLHHWWSPAFYGGGTSPVRSLIYHHLVVYHLAIM
jgi:hypothetical protein